MNQEPEKKESFSDKIVNYASSNTRDTLAYVLMLTGIFLLFFEPAYAGALIGVIAGLYFAPELTQVIKNRQHWFNQVGSVRSLILIGLIVAFFISAPFIFFGAVIAVAARQLLD